jgi:hypothetical protein
MLELMHSAEFRSLTSNNMQVKFFEANGIISNAIQWLVASKNQNLLCVDK